MLRIKSLVGFFFLATCLFAQDFEVSPVLMTFTANPGEIQTKQINLINHSGKPQKYTLKVSDYVVDAEGNKKSVPAGSTKRSCGEWIALNPSLVELNPNQSITIDALMTVPKDGFSSKWCMISVEVSKEQSAFDADKSLATGVVLLPRIVILVKQSPRMNNNYKATISGLKEVTKPGDKTRNFEVQVNNIGDNVIDAKVHLALANLETAAEEKFTPEKVTVYPDGSRIVRLQLPAVLKKGKYALAAIMDYGHRQPLGGTQMMLEIK